jgi:hypothetical protein
MKAASTRRALLATALAAMLGLPAAAQDGNKGMPSATIKVASEQMRLIMGGTAGKGVLTFNGQDYPFSFKTASAGLGAKAVKKVSAAGHVYGLTKIEDFPGSYTAISQATIAGKGQTSASYKSDKGVQIDLRGTVEGIGLSLGGGIATVELIKP